MGEHIKDKEYVPRITLLDAQYLDSEIYSLVKGQLRNATKYLGQSTAVRYEHEFDAVLRYIILNNTLQRTRSTIGQHLLKTKYQDTVSIGKMQFFVLASVMGHWLKERAHLFMKLIVRNPSKQHIIAKLDFPNLKKKQLSRFFQYTKFLLKYQELNITVCEKW
ncbi:peroxisomal biogenesis factor 2 isoform X2 [Oratosquilla oratoria]|uniref:peroxisomal biogenesis factor 2 isoform X2 n=1 Tax=Oratosquilla oratoria TaxID=337810 RepID=UPI003F767156